MLNFSLELGARRYSTNQSPESRRPWAPSEATSSARTFFIQRPSDQDRPCQRITPHGCAGTAASARPPVRWPGRPVFRRGRAGCSKVFRRPLKPTSLTVRKWSHSRGLNPYLAYLRRSAKEVVIEARPQQPNELVRRHSEIEILVNNLGSFEPMPFESTC